MIIKNADIIYCRVVGTIYGDEKGRFPDGSTIRTSEVQDFWKNNGKNYIKTKNSIYEVEYKEVK